jgi:hypothetical protein
MNLEMKMDNSHLKNRYNHSREKSGEGIPIVLVDGALCHRTFGPVWPLASPPINEKGAYMNHVVQFDPKNLPVTSVHLKMKNNLIPLSFDSHSWNLVIASLDEYQLIINNEIVIPDLSKDFIRKDDKIYSIPTSIKNNLESI